MSIYVAYRLARTLVLAGGFASLLIPAFLRARWTRDPDLLRRAAGRRLASFCERCGPAATKFAQLAAARADLLPRALVEPLARVQDRVRPPTRRSIRRALGKAYGAPVSWPFELLSWQPVASGSIAVVLKARVPDGAPIAIKLVRPGVQRRLKADLLCLSWLLRRVERLPRFRFLPLSLAFAHVAPLIARQADMFEEARAHPRLVRSLAAGIAMPALRPDLIRATALAMEFRSGLHRLTDPAVPSETYKKGCLRLLHSLYRMIFVHGFVHCDLHPGNVACEQDGTVLLYDYGLVSEVSHGDRQILAGLFGAVAQRNPRHVAREIIASAFVVPRALDSSRLEADASHLLDRWAGRPAGEFLVGLFAADLFEIQYRHGIRSSASFAAAVWALAAYEGLVRDRYPELDFQEEAKPFLISNLIATLRLAASGRGRPAGIPT